MYNKKKKIAAISDFSLREETLNSDTSIFSSKSVSSV